MKYYLDSNIFVRHLTKKPPEQAEKAKAIFAAIEAKRIEAKVSILVINEILWIMENFYEAPRGKFVPQLLHLLNLRNIKPLEMSKRSMLSLISEFQASSIDFTNLYINSLASPENDIVISFDKHFDKLEVKRKVRV